MALTNSNKLDPTPGPLKVKVANLLRDEIIAGRIPLGSQLSEKSISEDLQVSRTPVREAIMTLQSEGLVEVRPQSGTYVFTPDANEVIWICEMRLILELAAIKSAAKVTDKDELVKALKANLREAAKAVNTDLEECHLLDTGFHRLLIEASNNPFLVAAYLSISNRLHALRQLMPLTKTRLGRAVKQHRAVLDAIVSDDPETAQSIIEEHIENVKDVLLSQIAQLKSNSVIRTRRS